MYAQAIGLRHPHAPEGKVVVLHVQQLDLQLVAQFGQLSRAVEKSVPPAAHRGSLLRDNGVDPVAFLEALLKKLDNPAHSETPLLAQQTGGSPLVPTAQRSIRRTA